MRPSEAFHKHRAEIRRFIEANHGRNARVFGSVAKGTDDEDSDLDLLIDADSTLSLDDYGAMQYHIERLLGEIKLDLVTPNDLPFSLRHQVLKEAVPL